MSRSTGNPQYILILHSCGYPHMIELEVENYGEAVKALKERGLRFLGDAPETIERGAGIFIHPQSTEGMLIQMVQKGR